MVSNELKLSMIKKKRFLISLKEVLVVLIEKEIFMKYMKVSYLKYSKSLVVNRTCTSAYEESIKTENIPVKKQEKKFFSMTMMVAGIVLGKITKLIAGRSLLILVTSLILVTNVFEIVASKLKNLMKNLF